ncbi:type III pantothenate kinase [Salegentibacter sp. HM20]
MNLIVDVGNSFVKLAVFQNYSLKHSSKCRREDFFEKTEILLKDWPQLSQAILSWTVKEVAEEAGFLEKRLNLHKLTSDCRLPFKNSYATPNSLGKDRIALVAAAVKEFPGKNCLVIDAGTCVTYDFKTSAEEYLGGAISPGLNMRFEAMHKFTGNLPLLKAEDETKLLGTNTIDCMQSGALNGLVFEINSFVDAYMAEYKHLTIILTGGDYQILSKRVKNGIFANPNFLLEGLNHILEFNISQ